MRSNGHPGARRALPRRFRRLPVLLVGCGDVGLRLLEQFGDRARLLGTTRRTAQAQAIRRREGMPLAIDLDHPGRRRLGALARYLVYLAPPPAEGDDDPRLARLLADLARRPSRRRDRDHPIMARRLVYASTTGVFGPADGAVLTESAPARPVSARGRRRLAAERRLRQVARHQRGPVHLSCSIFRVPGIYAGDRLPAARLQQGLPALVAADDVFTNHVHADDLARLLWIGLFRGRHPRLYLASDGQDLKMGDYFDLVADHLGLARPPRLPVDAVKAAVSPAMWSFMSESRRLRNTRLLRELRLTLRYPDVPSALAALRDPAAKPAP